MQQEAADPVFTLEHRSDNMHATFYVIGLASTTTTFPDGSHKTWHKYTTNEIITGIVNRNATYRSDVERATLTYRVQELNVIPPVVKISPRPSYDDSDASSFEVAGRYCLIAVDGTIDDGGVSKLPANWKNDQLLLARIFEADKKRRERKGITYAHATLAEGKKAE